MYEIIVSNIGTVYNGKNKAKAFKTYREYVYISKYGIGRACGESVTMFRDGEIIREHDGDCRSIFHDYDMV